jgi:predicted nucleic acid-binding protein
MDKTEEIDKESHRLVETYYECHHPDSLILATAKVTGSALVSFDRDLLQTAKLEGVQAFLPRNFVRWW